MFVESAEKKIISRPIDAAQRTLCKEHASFSRNKRKNALAFGLPIRFESLCFIIIKKVYQDGKPFRYHT
jgi:hypothetical protein